ncbi:MAG: hypothetical protein HKN91_03705 [Acidimicrobiia bacterium]|nr:hypothetical protein [Acidimicrobiia bacterium]
MSETSVSQSNFANLAAVAWTVVPSAWGLSTLLYDDGGGDGFTFLGVLGWAALVAAGVFTMLAMLKVNALPGREGFRKAGLIALGLGILVTVPMFWAVPVWAGLYAVAMILFAVATPRVRTATLVIAGAMVLGVASLFILTALKVGTPDPTYGDYPVAWTTAFTVAAAGAAIGNVLIARSRAPWTRSVGGRAASENDMATAD